MTIRIKELGKMLCFCFIFLKNGLGMAQGIDTSILKRFDAGIVTRLLKITRNSELSPQSQYTIADYFRTSDSITKAWLIQGKPLNQIDSLQQEVELTFFQIANIRTPVNTSLLKKSFVNTSLIKDGYILPLSQFTIAIRCKEILKISPFVLDSLVYYVGRMAARQDSLQRLDPFSWVDFGAYESFHLSQLLTEEQYTQLLLLKNKSNAFSEAKKDWLEMERRGLDKGLDKEKTIAEMTNYYIKRYSDWNRWAHNSRIQIINMRRLEESKPQALKALDSARWNGEPESNDNNLKLQW